MSLSLGLDFLSCISNFSPGVFLGAGSLGCCYLLHRLGSSGSMALAPLIPSLCFYSFFGSTGMYVQFLNEAPFFFGSSFFNLSLLCVWRREVQQSINLVNLQNQSLCYHLIIFLYPHKHSICMVSETSDDGYLSPFVLL